MDKSRRSPPYRYRGYRYDTETGLNYLNSRYYNPEWGRFVNADAFGGKVGSLLSHNTFAYCYNNPVNMIDDDGYNPVVVFLYMWGAAIISSPDLQFDMQLTTNDIARGDVFGAATGLVGIMLPGVPSSVTKGGGKLIFKTGYSAEKYLRKYVGGVSKSMNTSLGRRIIDAFVDGVAHESKVGYTSAGAFIRRQVAKDAELLRKKKVKQVVWHFYKSDVTGKKGPSKQLADLLNKNGITFIIH